jgi:outer membrane lipoprotein-sorting protein
MELYFMKSFLRLSLTAIAASLFFGALTVTETNAQGGIKNEILNRMNTHYKTLKTLQADITRAQYNSQLDETDTSSGKISLVPGKGRNFSLRLDWIKPKQETLTIVNGLYTAYIPNIKRAYTGSSDSKTANDKGGNALKIMSMSKEELEANYVVVYLGQENVAGKIPTWRLKMTPRAAANYKYAELWVDGNGMPIQGKVIKLNDDTDTILLTNLGKNKTINASIFKQNLPKGTEIVPS